MAGEAAHQAAVAAQLGQVPGGAAGRDVGVGGGHERVCPSWEPILSFTRQRVAVKSICRVNGTVYDRGMPRIWSETIAAHRDAVRDATLDAAAALVDEHGLTGLTMSEIARRERHRPGHPVQVLPGYRVDPGRLARAADLRAPAPATPWSARRRRPAERLEAVLRAYVAQSGQRRGHGGDLAAMLHQGEHVTRAHAHLDEFITALISEAAARGEARDDIPAAELAAYCLHALTASAAMPSDAAVGRLVGVIAGRPAARPGRLAE